jgi:phospholipid transport system substrate-binding protein
MRDLHRAQYHGDRRKLCEIVTAVLLPHFDANYAARLALGLHWRSATAEQRQRFTNAFYESMLDQYDAALLDLAGDRLSVFPYRDDLNAQYASVRTQVRKTDGSLIGVDYGLRRTSEGWKVWDVVIDGIS